MNLNDHRQPHGKCGIVIGCMSSSASPENRPIEPFSKLSFILAVSVVIMLILQAGLLATSSANFAKPTPSTAAFYELSSDRQRMDTSDPHRRGLLPSPSVEWVTIFMCASVMSLACGYRSLDNLRSRPAQAGSEAASMAIVVGWSSLAIVGLWSLVQMISGMSSPFDDSNLSPTTEAIAGEFEPMVFFGSCCWGIISLFRAFSTQTPPLYKRRAADEGIVMASLLIAMLWQGYAILFHSDPSVEGFYAFSYFMMGIGCSMFFGKLAARLVAGIRDVDINERENIPAAIVQGSLILSTGLIFGGSVWGEADPTSDYEGGWWIPALFFVNGWVALVLLSVIGWRRLVSDIGADIKNENEVSRLASFAMYVVSCGLILFGQVSGDFYGWSHGLTAVLSAAALLAIQELLNSRRSVTSGCGNLALELAASASVVVFYLLSEHLAPWF